MSDHCTNPTHAKRIKELEATIKRVENEVHRGQISTWGTTEYWLGQIKAAIAGEGDD